MRACWLKWVGRDWSISADYIWLNYSGANSMVLDNHMCSLRANYAPLFFAFKRTPLEPVAQKHSGNKFPFN